MYRGVWNMQMYNSNLFCRKWWTSMIVETFNAIGSRILRKNKLVSHRRSLKSHNIDNCNEPQWHAKRIKHLHTCNRILKIQTLDQQKIMTKASILTYLLNVVWCDYTVWFINVLLSFLSFNIYLCLQSSLLLKYLQLIYHWYKIIVQDINM